jgi:ribosome-binding factor A
MIRINEEIGRVLAEFLRGEIKDPRVKSICSVVKVETSPDLKYCKAFISVMGGEDDKKSAMAGILSAGGRIRRAVAERVNLRVTPEFTFALDESLEEGMRIDALIRKIAEER